MRHPGSYEYAEPGQMGTGKQNRSCLRKIVGYDLDLLLIGIKVNDLVYKHTILVKNP